MGLGLTGVWIFFFFPWDSSYSELPVWRLPSYCIDSIVYLPNLGNKKLMIKIIS